jgi:hypothetical protein
MGHKERDMKPTITIKTDEVEISDGYHTFTQLYDHRIRLYITLCNYLHVFANKDCWKSKKHSDGSVWEGWFLAGIGKDKGHQITYHLPMSVFYDLHVPELEHAPEFDGHTPEDVLERLKLV